MSYKVLIVEDEGLIAHDIASRLQSLGHTVVHTASTAEEAVEHAADAEVVLMDIRLDGDRDGIEAAHEIRARYHLPVIFLTAHADRHTLERAKLADPFGYIVKPMGHASLQTALEVTMHRHKLERELEQRESWLRTTLSSVAEAVVVTDAQGCVILANEAARILFGVRSRPGNSNLQPGAQTDGKYGSVSDVGDMMDLDLAELLHGDPIRLSILRDEPVKIDTHIREQAVEGSAAPVKAGGSIVGTVLTLRNVTVQRWQEQQLRQAQKMEAAARLAAGVSSEYATLLAIVRKETQRLLGRFTGQSAVRQSLEEIQHATLQAEEMTRRLSGLGTRQVGRPEPLSLNTLIRKMQKSLESVVSEELALSTRLEPSLDKIHADPAQIEQMILNLATVMGSESYLQSDCFTPGFYAGEAPKLVIQTASAGDYVRLRVFACPAGGAPITGAPLDELRGDAPEGQGSHQGHAGSEGHSSSDQPVPLELSLAHAIATEYDGLLTAEEHGFQVLLPAWKEAGPPPVRNEAPHTLLLIEARESVRMQLHNFFETAGFNLLEASDREEAMTLLEIHGAKERPAEGDGGAPVEPPSVREEAPAHFAGGLTDTLMDTPMDTLMDTLMDTPAIDLVLGPQEATRGIDGVPVIVLDQPKVQAMTQQDLLHYVRAQLTSRVTFSASA